MLEVKAVPALSDNYIWIVATDDSRRVAVVDPGDAAPVADHLAKHDLEVGAYLITHHHADHVGGLRTLLARYPAPVYGPAMEADRIGNINHGLGDGDRFSLDCLGAAFEVIDVPGHTLGHIAYVSGDILLAGDALFRAGCGRVFEGTHQQMQRSLARLKTLPDATRVYGGHEYTQKNLAFAKTVEPDNPAIDAAIDEVDALRTDGRPSLPGRMAEERRINPFLRWDDDDVRAAASRHVGRELTDPGEIFGVLRDWKDAS